MKWFTGSLYAQAIVALFAPFLVFWLAYSKRLRWLMWIGLVKTHAHPSR